MAKFFDLPETAAGARAKAEQMSAHCDNVEVFLEAGGGITLASNIHPSLGSQAMCTSSPQAAQHDPDDLCRVPRAHNACP
jgi:hypothetical protein